VDIGSEIGERGWGQGCLLHDADLRALVAAEGFDCHEGAVAIVVSQSCDLANRDLESEPFAEVIIGQRVATCSHDLLYGKHPRRLHLPIQCNEGGTLTLDLVPWQRRQIRRELLAGWVPADNHYLLRDDIAILTAWLAQRYVRSALPDSFNDLIAQKRKKWKKIRKKLSGHVSGLFVELNPSGELAPDQRYSVNLLALVPVVHKASLGEVQADVQRLSDLMKELGMEVNTAAKAEDDISYAVVRRMTRFPLEYLSLRGEPFDPLPAEFDI